MRPRNRAVAVGVLLAAALVFRLCLAVWYPSDEADDSAFYKLAARNVVLHGVYSGETEPPWVPTYVRVPGYSLFIAAVYGIAGVDNDTAVRIAQAAVDTATCWFVACLALALTPRTWLPQRRRRAQLAALALAAACPFSAAYVMPILTEALALALGTALAWFAARGLAGMAEGPDRSSGVPRRTGWWWLAAGLAGGALTMVRPEGGVLTAGAGVALVIVSLWRSVAARQAWRGAVSVVLRAGAMLCLGFLVFDGAWIVRNALVFGDFQPLNPRSLSMPGDYEFTGYNRWLKTWLDDPKYIGPFYFEVDRSRMPVDQLPARAVDSPQERQLVAELFALYNDGSPTPGTAAPAPHAPPAGLKQALDQRFGRLADERIRRHPVRYYLLLPAQRLFRIWVGPHAQYYPFDGDLFPLKDLDTRTYQHIWLPLFAGLVMVWSVFGLVGGAGLLADPSARAGLLLVLLVTVPRLAFIGSMENPEPRYTVELFPLLSALGGVATAKLWPPGRDAAADA